MNKPFSNLDSLINSSNGRSASSRNPLPESIFIPLDSNRLFTFGLKINRLCKTKTLIKHLCGHCIFKGITVIEWYLLYEYISHNKKSDDLLFFASLSGILSMSSTSRKGVLRSFESQMRPIRKMISSIRLKREIHKGETLDWLLNILSVPKTLMSKDDLFVLHKVCWENPRPREVNRMGVGYRDKGSLGVDFVEVAPPKTDELIVHSFEEKSFLQIWKSLLE